MNSEWSTIYNGVYYVWKPVYGLDPSLGEQAMWAGAQVYAVHKSNARPEAVCQVEAEKAAFEMQYRVRYTEK
jgi:hypothetical protein